MSAASVLHPDWLRPQWHAPHDRVGSLMSTRAGGVSRGPWAGLNLGTAVQDDPAAVAENRRIFQAALQAAPVFMKQVHGVRVLQLGAADAVPGAPPQEADACVTATPGVACVAQAADCLPVLFMAPQARAVGAAHAGWRGLAAGVLEAALAQVCALAGCAPGDVQAWLGACIGPRRFEVGGEVLAAFGAARHPAVKACFAPGHAPGKWLADLAGLARWRLAGAGVTRVSGGDWCTVEDPSRFFSFRRDGAATGRMAAAIWLRG